MASPGPPNELSVAGNADGSPLRYREGITLGPDNHVWISDPQSRMIGWIDTTGAITAYQVRGTPFALTAGPDGNLWFTELFDQKIAKVDPATGTVLAEYDATNAFDIVAGPDANLWFTRGNQIGRITTDGVVTLFPIPTGNAFAYGITVGPDGNLWFTEYLGYRIGRITPAGNITEIHIPEGATGPRDIATGPDGHLWFTELGVGKIAEIDPTTIMGRPPPCLVVTQSLTLTHDVGPCPGTGIVVAANNVKLDLNGHKVFAAPGPRYGDFAGILLRDASGVTVSNGTVTGFDAGVAVEGGSANTITRLNVHHNPGGGPAGTYGDGIVLSSSSANQVVNNVVNQNGNFDGIGVIGLDSNNNVIRANQVTNTDFGDGIVINPFVGFDSPRFGESVTGNQVIGNLVRLPPPRSRTSPGTPTKPGSTRSGTSGRPRPTLWRISRPAGASSRRSSPSTRGRRSAP